MVSANNHGLHHERLARLTMSQSAWTVPGSQPKRVRIRLIQKWVLRPTTKNAAKGEGRWLR